MGTYSREEAAQVPNQWWDFWDFFPNVSEREIENPYDHNWARRPEVVEQNYDEEGNLKESLQLNLSGYPIPKYTREGDLYYTTVKDESGKNIPSNLSNETWREKLPYPFGKKRDNLSDYAFASWLFNQAPSQIAPVGALAKGIPQIRTQRRTSPHGFYKEGSIDVNQKNVEKIFSLSRFENTRNKGLLQDTFTAEEIWGVGGSPTTQFMSVKDPLGQGELFDDEQEKFPRKKLTGKGEDLTKPTLIPSKLDKGGYSVKDLEGAGPFDITGQGEFREFREFAGAMQDPRFSDNDFYLWQKELAEALLKKYPEMTKEELAIRQHHFNPIKQGARLINGLDPVERAKAVAFLAERGVFSGNTPAQDYAIPNSIHTKVHDFINDRIGKQLDKLYDKVNLENLTTFESRKSYIKKYARVIRQSEEFIYSQLQKLAAEKQAESKRITGWEPWVGDALKGLPPEELVDILHKLPGLPDYVNDGTYERVVKGYQRLLDAVSGKKPKRVRSRRSEFESNLKRYAKSEGIYEDSAQLNMWSNFVEGIFGKDREE